MKKAIIGCSVLVILVAAFSFFLYDLGPVNAAGSATGQVFEIQQGDGFRAIANNLYQAKLIKSPLAFEFFSLFGGRALTMKPGLYRLNPAMDVSDIVQTIAGNAAGSVTVVIPEGSNVYQIDKILSDALVIHPGDLVTANANASGTLEGMLFPDTYNFYTDANVEDVIKELVDNFNMKAGPLLANAGKNEEQDLILASIIDKEVPDVADQEIVAGILLKRIAAGIPLDVDATICYAKFQESPLSPPNCYPLTPLDFKIESPYNSYLHKGLPPTPIGNPGTAAISAALDPQASAYWYYLSDPTTGKTIFAKTLDEQNQNTIKYLESN